IELSNKPLTKMYFPYLRARQFELIALREFAFEQDNFNKIIPIVEPVKESFNSFKIAFKIFEEFDFSFALILNPQVGEISNNNKILENLEGDLEQVNWIPAFIVNQNIY